MPRRALVVVLVTLAAPATVEAQAFRYVPDTARYEAEVVTLMIRELGANRTEDEITQRQRLSVRVGARRGDTLALRVVIDSAALRTRATGVQNVGQLVGLQVVGSISPLGQVYTSAIEGRGIGPAGAVVAGELARFLPRLRPDLRIGLAWTDTTTEQIDMLGLPVTRTTVTASTVRGDTAVLGERGWKIDRVSSVRFAGAGTLAGQTISMTGTSESTGAIVVSRGGRYLGSLLADVVTTRFSSPGSGMEIALTQHQTTRVARTP